MDRDKAFRYVYDLVEMLLRKNGSDLFFTAGSPPGIKVDGVIHRVGSKKLSPAQTSVIAHSVMNDRQQRNFEETHELNFALNYPDVARFRVSAFMQRNSYGMVMRLIKSHIPTIEELHLPPLLKDVALEKRGLVIFLGGTGCGKSTSLAAMVDYRNQNAQEHIITIEDPIEFFHRHKSCIVDQREVGVDTESYAVALKNTLRQAPNVIMIGEVRDRETMEQAINFAETGHLCLTTLHANNSNQAFDRIINFFPDNRRPQLLMDMAFNMKAFISQRLIARADEPRGLVPAVEVLLNTPLMQELVFQGRIAEIKEHMAKSSEQGLITFDQSLFRLYEEGKISYENALRHADSVNNLRIMIKLQSKQPPAKGLAGDIDSLEIQE